MRSYTAARRVIKASIPILLQLVCSNIYGLQNEGTIFLADYIAQTTAACSTVDTTASFNSENFGVGTEGSWVWNCGLGGGGRYGHSTRTPVTFSRQTRRSNSVMLLALAH